MSTNKNNAVRLKNYVIGYAISLLLTIVAYIVVANHVDSEHSIFSHSFVLWVVMSLATIQLIVQSIYFLHLGKEAKPKWNLMAYLFMVMVVLIIVIGSLWIMNNLHYNVDPNNTKKIIQEKENIYLDDTKKDSTQQNDHKEDHEDSN